MALLITLLKKFVIFVNRLEAVFPPLPFWLIRVIVCIDLSVSLTSKSIYGE